MIAPIKKHFNSWTYYFKNILSEERKLEYALKEYLPLNVYDALYLRENNYINSAQYKFQFYLHQLDKHYLYTSKMLYVLFLQLKNPKLALLMTLLLHYNHINQTLPYQHLNVVNKLD